MEPSDKHRALTANFGRYFVKRGEPMNRETNAIGMMAENDRQWLDGFGKECESLLGQSDWSYEQYHDGLLELMARTHPEGESFKYFLSETKKTIESEDTPPVKRAALQDVLETLSKRDGVDYES